MKRQYEFEIFLICRKNGVILAIILQCEYFLSPIGGSVVSIQANGYVVKRALLFCLYSSGEVEMGVIDEHVQSGIKYKIEGNYESATTELLEAVKIDPKHAEAHRQLGLVYGFEGLFDESIEELKIAVDLNVSNAAIRADLGMTYAMLGMFDEAKAEFELVLQIDPSNETARKQMIYF
jgi:Tfp pilus assembly protein PilF